jgi:small conductance mechanosensitive channel
VAGSLPTLQEFLFTSAIVLLELGLIGIAAWVAYALVKRTFRRATTGYAFGDVHRAVRVKARNGLLTVSILLAGLVLGYNIWLVTRGVAVPGHTAGLVRSVTADLWIRFAVALGYLLAAAVAMFIALGVARRLFQGVEAALNRWDGLRDNDKSLAALFSGLNRALVHTGWLLLAVLACWLLAVPPRVIEILLLVVRIYVIVAVGLLVIRSTAVIVNTFDGLSRRYAHARGWLRHYDDLHSLVPMFRMCLEYAMWIALAVLVLAQTGAFQKPVAWGPLLIQAIGMFFVGRVVIELGRLEIERRMLPSEGLDEMTLRRRATIAPLIRSTFAYAVYFATAVLILGSLGFNPMPFLAGAGILGLVIGFGAQSLINDVVSGFFILFENTYLVGDVIEAAGAKGTVEAIEFRTTKIRDGDGRVHIVRNGDVKQVINYSKDFTMAVVPVEVLYDADLRSVFTTLREAASRVRAENSDVLAETQIDGISAFGPSTMTVRTSTRVKPGRHESAGAALRLAIKEAFDRRASGAPRKGLIPEGLAVRTAHPARGTLGH